MPAKKQKQLSQKVMDELMEGMNDTVLAVVRVGTNRHPVWGTMSTIAYSEGDFSKAPTYALLKLVRLLNLTARDALAEAMRRVKK